MSRCIETIQLLKGELRNLDFHQERFERTRREVLGLRKHPQLSEQIQVPEGLEKGLIKCRVIYDKEILRIEYEPPQTHKVDSLQLVYSDSIEYGFKYEDRTELLKLFKQRGKSDDILVVKKGCISDSFYANVIFWNGFGWITPDTPLLHGTMRAYLISVDLIGEERITPDDLPGFKLLKLINAMNDLEQAPEIPIESIHL